jgi:hypothetical protein
MRFLGQGQRSMDVTMGLEIGPAQDNGRCGWTIIYDGSAGRQVRPYELVTVDAQAGLYQIDERNGIVLPARLVDGTLFSEFEVQGQRIAVRYERGMAADGAPVMRVEMCTTAEARAVRTGGGAVPEVRGWTPQAVQRIELRRQSPAG